MIYFIDSSDYLHLIIDLTTGLFMGYGIGQLLGAYLYQHYGYLTSYLIVPALICLDILYCCLVLPGDNEPVLCSEKLDLEDAPPTGEYCFLYLVASNYLDRPDNFRLNNPV